VVSRRHHRRRFLGTVDDRDPLRLGGHPAGPQSGLEVAVMKCRMNFEMMGRMRRRNKGLWNDDPDNGRPSPNRLYRNMDNAMLRGVCSGIADFFGIDPMLVRLAAVACLFAFTVPSIIIYFFLSKVVPPRPEGLFKAPGEEAFWTRVRVEPTGTFSSLRHRFRELDKRLQDLETFVTSREFRLDREINGLK
jgi:phage shock protein C